MRGRIEAMYAERWTVTELLDIRDMLLSEWDNLGWRAHKSHIPLMLGDCYRDLVAVCGQKQASLEMARRDQETGRCPVATW